MIETVIRKRIEILADQAQVKRVSSIIDEVGITGWTVLPVTSGKGREGRWREERVMGTDKNLVVTIASQENANALAEALAPILTSHGFLLTMWDVEVIRGEIFVVRNVAALVPPFEISPGQHGVSAALEFAIQFLHVRQIVVMGHGMCGGCKAALTRDLHGTAPGDGGFIANWVRMLDEARDEVAAKYGTEGREAERAMEMAAVGVSLANLRTFPCVREKEADGTLKLRGAFFSIAEGVLYVRDEESGQFQPAK